MWKNIAHNSIPIHYIILTSNPAHVRGSFVLDVVIKIILVAAVVTLFFLYTGKEASYAYVDSQKIIASYKGMEEAVKEYQAKVKAWTANVDTLRSELEKLRQSVRDAKGGGRVLVENTIRDRQFQLENYEVAIRNKIYEEDKALTNVVMDKVNDYLKRYGEKMNYSIILGSQNGNIVYGKEGLDITDEVIKGLNEEYGR